MVDNKIYKIHPIVSQYNTIKVSLLIYRICFKIKEKELFSLVTKCTTLENYLIDSLCMYFEK